MILLVELGEKRASMVQMPRAKVLALLLGLTAGAAALPAVLVAGESVALAHEEGDLDVGTQLVAVTDVTLHRAEIMKGSKVRVTKVAIQGGRVASVDVELADGHVVQKVAVTKIRTAFRIDSDD